MNGLTLVVLLHVSLAAAQPDSYADARRETTRTGRPMVVLVGAKWCPACVEMKQDVVPKVRRRGGLQRVSFAFVDLDRQRRLGRELTDGGPIPQLIMFRHTPDGWRRRTLVGGQNPEAVERFIRQGVELDEATRRQKEGPAKDTSPEDKPADKTPAKESPAKDRPSQ